MEVVVMMDMMADDCQALMTNNEYRVCSIFRSFQWFSVEVLLRHSEMILSGPLQVTVHPMLRAVVLFVCNVGVLWPGPNGWMDQDATWYGDRPQPRPHCVRWIPSSPPTEGAPQLPPHFLAHIYCVRMVSHLC